MSVIHIKELEKMLADAKEENRVLKKKLLKFETRELGKELGVELESISVGRARKILFSDAYNQLYYSKSEGVHQVLDSNRQWAYDNADGMNWYIGKERSGQSDVKDVPVKEDAKSDVSKESSERTFQDKRHEVRFQDLPMYLKVFRYEMKLKMEDIEPFNGTDWSKYERGKAEPREKTIKRIEDYCNIEIIYESRVKTLSDEGFDERLKELILSSYPSIAKFARVVGMKQATMSNYITAGYYPSPNTGTMNKMADALNVSICYLLTGENDWE